MQSQLGYTTPPCAALTSCKQVLPTARGVPEPNEEMAARLAMLEKQVRSMSHEKSKNEQEELIQTRQQVELIQKEDMKKLESELEKTRSEYDRARSEVEVMKVELNEVRNKSEQAKRELQRKEYDYTKIVERHATEDQRFQGLTVENAELKRENQVAMQKVRQLESVERNQQEKCHEHERNMNDAIEQYQRLKGTIKAIESEANLKVKKAEEARRSHQNAEEEAYAKLSEVTAEKEQLHWESQQLQARLSEWERQKIQYEHSRSADQAEIQDLKRKLTTSMVQQQDFETQKKALQEQNEFIESLESQLRQEQHTASPSSLTEFMRMKAHELPKLSHEVTQLKLRLCNKDTDLMNTVKKLDELKRENQEVKRENQELCRSLEKAGMTCTQAAAA